MLGIETKNQRDWKRIEEIGVYICCHQNTVLQYIATRSIMDFCLAKERNPGMRLSSQWWEKPALDILGIRAGHVDTEGGKETGVEESEAEGEV